MTNLLYGNGCSQRQVVVTKADSDFRPAFRRDYARLIHSPSFRRLQGKTQLYPGHESDFFRNRLTHSLEVAQIAKGIAEQLNYNNDFLKENPINLDLVEFAALAHDLGHPPFGHNGEHALDDCMKDWGGFEGNAQTLRLLAVCEKKVTEDGANQGITAEGNDNRRGLNLTYRALAAVLKYDKAIPFQRNKTERLVKGYYESEKPLISAIKEAVSSGASADKPFKTIECHIMDLADDIAYSTYDLEDGLKGGFVDPLMLLSTIRSDVGLLDRVTKKVAGECPKATEDDVVNAIASVFNLDIDGNFKGVAETPLEMYEMSKLIASNTYLRTELTSSLVSTFINGISFEKDDETPCLSKATMREEIKLTVEALKHLNFEVTIMSPRLKLVEYRGYEIVREIFKALTEDEGYLLLPEDVKQCYQRLSEQKARMRLICDFVAGMTDRYAIEFFGRLKQGDQSIFKPF
ncbi:MAG: dNTP triphosphohydrolase [Azonexus sp.]|nr:dNTP triphosphohydrolase [Azonexus sp.]MBP8168187.1 dNTP triphosphohydrolase [Azonexus sp.]